MEKGRAEGTAGRCCCSVFADNSSRKGTTAGYLAVQLVVLMRVCTFRRGRGDGGHKNRVAKNMEVDF